MTTESIYQILAGHHEMTLGQLYKKCLDQKISGITNQKSVSNALTRLKKEGKAASEYDKNTGMWLLRAIRDENPERSSDECWNGADPYADYQFSQPAEMAYDIAEIGVTTPNVVNHDAECRDQPRKARSRPYTPNKVAGAYTFRGSLVIKLDRRTNAKSITLTPADMAMLVAIQGNLT